MISRQVLAILQRSKTTKELLQIHSVVLKTGLDYHPFIVSRFILYSCPISVDFSRCFFDSLPVIPPIFAWNTIIRAYTSSSSSSSSIESVKLFAELLRIGLKPDNFTYPFVLKACGICSLADHGSAVHSLVLRDGLGSDKYIGNTLLRMYGACNEMTLARKVFDEMPHTDVASWSSMIATYVACNCPIAGLMLFHEMRKMCQTPNSVTLVSVLSACSSVLKLSFGRCIHAYIIVSRIELDVSLGTSLLEMYGKCGEIQKALKLFSSMSEKNLQSWTIMISSLANHGYKEGALALFTEMKEAGLKPDSMSFSAIISACSHLGLVEEGRRYFDQMTLVHGIKPTMHHYGCMVDMFGRAGLIQDAYEIIKNMPMKPNSVILRSLIGSSRNHGFNLCDGLEQALVQLEPELGANYVLAASLFSSSGSHDNAAGLRVDMKNKHLKKVSGYSWVEANGVQVPHQLLMGHGP